MRSIQSLFVVAVIFQHITWKGLSGHVSLVISCLDKFNCLSVSSLISLVDTNYPTFRGECLGEVMQFEVFVAGVGISHVIVTFWFAVLGVNLPGTIVAEFVHEAVLHRGEDHIVNSVSISGDIVFFFNVRVNSSTDSHHPQKLIDIVS